jgi:hypothetical protein
MLPKSVVFVNMNRIAPSMGICINPATATLFMFTNELATGVCKIEELAERCTFNSGHGLQLFQPTTDSIL